MTAPISGWRGRRLLYTAFCLFLLWRGGASLIAVFREIRVVNFVALARAASLPQEDRIRAALGEEYPLFLTLRATVPEDAVVTVVTERSVRAGRVLLHMAALLYPRRFVWIEAMPSAWHPSPAPRQSVFVLELFPPGEASLRHQFELVESSDWFRLWRLRDAPSRGL